MSENIRVRFAPSPTGPLHMGGVRTALYNYLFARKNDGKMILRIEDTDQTRFVPGAEQYIMESLAWCGIQFDEGIIEGGSYGPYRQSERKSIYAAYSDQLIQSGNAYYAFDTAEELDELRKQAEAERKTFIYNSESRKSLRNSLNMNDVEVKKHLDEGVPYVVRFLIPENTSITMNDLIRGTVTVKSETLDDKVLFKSDGMPTYHLANIVDDHLMEISHVIRGEEWLPSLPLHVLLYEAFEWKKPQFAHLPLLLKPDGNGKLSKRDGDRLGFPVFPMQWKDPTTGEISSGYRENGYYPEAFVNMLALLGWNPGSDQEIFGMNELIEAFSLDRVGKSGSKFDPEKTKWFNHQYLIRQTDEALAQEWLKWLKAEKNLEPEKKKVVKIVSLIKERVNFVQELWEEANFFFETPESYDEKVVKKRWKTDSSEQMKTLAILLDDIQDFSAEMIDEKIKIWITENELSMGGIMNALRLLLVGAAKGPHLGDIMEVLGKTESIKRISSGIKALSN
ncbi:MAG: glutamate--tRNA ligase [Bacteroidales bacterium]|nr:glutamate--tRNA ligase [Bacteroidales bacterium]HOI31691.1 glutamate--tRNA ligase [Bacteroidales bacterium]